MGRGTLGGLGIKVWNALLHEHRPIVSTEAEFTLAGIRDDRLPAGTVIRLFHYPNGIEFAQAASFILVDLGGRREYYYLLDGQIPRKLEQTSHMQPLRRDGHFRYAYRRADHEPLTWELVKRIAFFEFVPASVMAERRRSA